jgi:hypothetical protein
LAPAPEHILAGKISWTDYRPAHHSAAVRIDHHRTRKKFHRSCASPARRAWPARTAKRKCPAKTSTSGGVANKALELLRKELGMFIDRKEVGGPNEFERMSDEELMAFIEEQTELIQSMQSGLPNANGRSKH